MAAKIRKGDNVIVLAGRDRGRTGEVIEVRPDEGRALVRGVRVTIIVPGTTDFHVLDRINHYYVEMFSKLGANCFFGGEMNHAKAMLIDERVGTVGSQNLDTLSFAWNAEAGIFFDDPRMVRDLNAIVNKWKMGARAFTAGAYPARWYDALLAFFVRLFQRIP